jgi:hypothetical protein
MFSIDKISFVSVHCEYGSQLLAHTAHGVANHLKLCKIM